MKKGYILLMVLMISNLIAQVPNLTLSQIYYGSAREFPNARALALGGSGLAGGLAVHGAMLNPALLATNEKQIQGSVSGYIYYLEEDRAYPYYDNFGGFVDFGNYVYNSNTYGDFTISTIVKLPVLAAYNFNLGLGINSLLDYNYDYLEEVRSTSFGDALLGYNRINSDGIWREINLSVGFNLMPPLAFGLKLGFITGSVSQQYEIFPVDVAQNNNGQKQMTETELNNTPINVNLGGYYRLNPQFSIGASIKLPLTVKTENTFQIMTNLSYPGGGLLPPDQLVPGLEGSAGPYDSTAQSSYVRKLEYPLTLAVGLEYRFTNILEARINADFAYTFWSDFKDDLNSDLIFSDTYVFKVGLEHIFFDQLPFRVGFQYQPLKENRDYTRVVLTAGVGLIFDQFELDLSGGLENMTTNQLDLFDDGLYPPLVSRTDVVDRVQTNYLYGMIEFRIGLDNVY